jgi:hypothetical protein
MNYRNAKYIDSTRVDCEINHRTYGWIPYTLDPRDTDMTVDNVSLLASMIKNKDVAAYVPPTKEELNVKAAASIRDKRDFLLSSEVDKTVSNPLRWADMSEEKQAEWAAYRRALLDITDQGTFPTSVTWPTKPSE